MKRSVLKKEIAIAITIMCSVLLFTVSAMGEQKVTFLSEMEERGGGGNECYQYIINIKQTKTYNCGTTSVMQILYGLGYEDEVQGDTIEEKIQTLDDAYGVDTQRQTYVGQIADALNEYIPGSTTYECTSMTNKTLDEFETMVANSLTYGKPVVLRAMTGAIGYYGGKNTGHYLCIDYINRTTDRVRIVDCNYNSPYYGTHYVDLEEAYNAVAGRHIVH